MNWLKLIPLVPTVIRFVENLVNKPQAPQGKDAARKAKAEWDAAKRRRGK